jgi:osmotically-inducible protein OsmY
MKLDLGQKHGPKPGDVKANVAPQDNAVLGEQRPIVARATDEVAAWFGNVDALGRRQRDEAVGDHAGKGPAGDTAADARLLAEVTDRLTQDAKLDASGIRVDVMAGSVTLSGSVLTAADKLAAGKDAESVGAGHVTNNLIVS